MRASWAGNDIAPAGTVVGTAAGAAVGTGVAGAPASLAPLERASRRRVTTAGANGFTGEVYIGYAPRSRGRMTVPQKSNEKVELKIDDKVVEMPVIVGSENERGIDIGKLRAQTGY